MFIPTDRRQIYCDRPCAGKAWREKNKERARALGQKYHKQKSRSPARLAATLFRSARARAVKAGEEFTITRKWIEERVVRGACEVTGIPFVLSLPSDTHRGPWGPSLDRIDNRYGYVWWNVQIVCWAYNKAKGEWPADVLHRLARAVLRPEIHQ